jgi:hypothetical protein
LRGPWECLYMRKPLFLFQCLTAAAVLTLTASASLAQQKTVRACDAEWRANKATLQNEGKKKKDFMIQCRLGQAAASPAIPAPDATNQNRTARDTTAPAQSPRRGPTISTGAGSQGSLPGRNRRLGQYPLQGLSFPRVPLLREYETGCIYVRARYGVGRDTFRKE